jgi:hypothetical protein
MERNGEVRIKRLFRGVTHLTILLSGGAYDFPSNDSLS